jgi:Actin
MRMYFFSLPLKESNTVSFCRFAAGKGSALVVDVGQTMASITPVVDGFVLRKGESLFTQNTNALLTLLIQPGLAYSALPRLIHAQARHILTSPTAIRRGIDLLPYQLITNKMVCYIICMFRSSKIVLLQARGTKYASAVYPSKRPHRGNIQHLASMG